MSKVRIISLYLPQFHPIQENDDIWGKGFTEWTNVTQAKPQYKGHYQPQIPSELGFYDLRMEEARIAQAELAREYGIEGFCYWHYWFGNGKRILELPFQKVLESGKPDFPFCLCWANHSWSTKTWKNSEKKKEDIEFLKQDYYGIEDYKMHFKTMLPAFLDKRYIRIDDRPLFAIFDPLAIPSSELKNFIDVWNELALRNGLKGFHFVARLEGVGKLTDSDVKLRMKGELGDYYQKYINLGFNAIWSDNRRKAEIESNGYEILWIKRALFHLFKTRILSRHRYIDIIKHLYTDFDTQENVYPMLIPRWDKTPRQGKLATIYTDSTPDLFKYNVENLIELIKYKQDEHKIVFLQAWNEWGEGNYMEPDIKFGRRYLEALREALEEAGQFPSNARRPKQ